MAGVILLGLSLLEAAPIPNTLRGFPQNPTTSVQENEQAGSSVAISGDWTVVGSRQSDWGGHVDSGVVHVYEGSAPEHPAFTLENPSPADGDSFGGAVAISNDWVVVGASADDTGADAAGIAYVFDLSGATPTIPVFVLPNPEPGAGDSFGCSVAISGHRVVIGARTDRVGNSQAGRVFVFNLTTPTPTVPILILANPQPGHLDFFGDSVAISGPRIIVGSPGDDSVVSNANASNVGRAYAYNMDASEASVPLIIANPSPAAGDAFGSAVSISGDLAAVGAGGDYYDQGTARIYDLSSQTPTVAISTISNPSSTAGDDFGDSLSISPGHLVVGSRFDKTFGTNSGIAYSYVLDGAIASLPPTPLEPATPFGFAGSSVAVDGDRCVVGAPENDGGALFYDLAGDPPGRAVFTLSSPGPASGEKFGAAVAISGNLMAAGTNGALPGHVHVFNLYGATPDTPAFTLQDPDLSGGRLFGSTIAVSGSRVLVGEPSFSGESDSGGTVHLYDLTGPSPETPVFPLIHFSGNHNNFGHRLTMNGPLAAVADSYPTPGGRGRGVIYIYDFSSPNAAYPKVTLENPATGPDAFLGSSMALSGNRLAVGGSVAHGEADVGRVVYVFDLTSATPGVPVLTLANPDGTGADTFGLSLALSGNLLLASDWGSTNASGSRGRGYVFDLDATAPQDPIHVIDHPGGNGFDFFGWGLAIDGKKAVIAAKGWDGEEVDSGRAFVYQLDHETPEIPVAILNNPSPGPDDQFGTSLAIAGDRVVVGTPEDDSVNFNMGSVHVFGPSLASDDYYEWARSVALPEEAADPDQMPFGDSVENLLKYAFNMDGGATDVTILAPVDGVTGLPMITYEGDVLRIEFLKRRNSGLLYTPKVATSLESFEPLTATPAVHDIDDFWQRVVVEHPCDPATTPRCFGVVEVELP